MPLIKSTLNTIFKLAWITIIGFSVHAQAEKWQAVTGVEKFLSVEVDVDSIKPASYEDMVYFTVRADDHDNLVTTKSVLASCSEFSMEVEREQLFNKTEQTKEMLEWKKNPALKNDERYAHARLSFWGYTQAYGSAIKLACSKISNKAPKRLEAYVQEDCEMSNPLYRVACSLYPTWRANYKLYMGRSHDSIFNCGVSEERMSQQTAALLKNVMRCKNESCGNQILETWIQRRGDDIATVIHMQNGVTPNSKRDGPICTSIPAADQEIARINSEEMYAKAKYVGCLKRQNIKSNNVNDQASKQCGSEYKALQQIVANKKAGELDDIIPDIEGADMVFVESAIDK